MPAEAAECGADPVVLRRSLALLGDVTVRDAGTSTIYLVGDRAYKLHKPLPFAAGNQSRGSVELARQELALNASLAPGVALGVRSVVRAAAGSDYELGPGDDRSAIDHVVEMRRFDQADTMSERIRAGSLTDDQAAAIGSRIAAFHRSATRVPGGGDYRRLVDRNFEALFPLAEGLVPPLELLAYQRFAAAFLISWSAVLEARSAAGSVIDGHGALRAGHILMEDGAIRIVGRAQEAHSRVVDVADELGGLLTDLRLLSGSSRLGAAVLEGYRAADGGTHPRALVAFFSSYRAQVRFREALVAAALAPGGRRENDLAAARELLVLSRRLSWRAREPLMLLITGSSTAGKIALVTALAAQSGFPVVSLIDRPDSARQSSLHDAGYAWLANRAMLHPTVIVEAPFDGSGVQRTFVEATDGHPAGHALVIEYHHPTSALADFETMRGSLVSGYVSVDTLAALPRQIDVVASWLDSVLATDGAP